MQTSSYVITQRGCNGAVTVACTIHSDTVNGGGGGGGNW